MDAVCEGELTPEQWSKLEICLERSPEVPRLLMDHVWLCTQVNVWSKGQRSAATGLVRIAGAMPVLPIQGLSQPLPLWQVPKCRTGSLTRRPLAAFASGHCFPRPFTVPFGGVLFG